MCGYRSRVDYWHIVKTTSNSFPIDLRFTAPVVDSTPRHFLQTFICFGMRCTVRYATQPAESLGAGGWSQHKYVTRKIRKSFNKVRTSNKANRSPERVEEHLALSIEYVQRAGSLAQHSSTVPISDQDQVKVLLIQHYDTHARPQIDQISRRNLKGETIAQDEKEFSIFEPHTYWISKGKVRVPQELGVAVSVVEDQYRFILQHQIMWEGSDVDYAVSLVADTRASFPDLRACSFDKGFHSPANQRELGDLLDECTVPRKGRLSGEARKHESKEWFKDARKRHPGVESAINHLDHCGFDWVRAAYRAVRLTKARNRVSGGAIEGENCGKSIYRHFYSEIVQFFRSSRSKFHFCHPGIVLNLKSGGFLTDTNYGHLK